MAPSEDLAYSCSRLGQTVVTIDVLPDDVLLTIFDFHVFQSEALDLHGASLGNQYARMRTESWQLLVHVCQRWRELVFGSPRRLNLQLYCAPGTSARNSSDVWPALPLLVQDVVTETSLGDIIAELKYSDRIRQISLSCRDIPQLEKLWTAMRVPFPELEVLSLSGVSWSYVSVLTDSLLAGSAPRLRTLYLDNILFLGLPKLHLTAAHLADLWLLNVPHFGYISPEAMATCLSTLTGLRALQLDFESPQSSPEQENRYDSPPSTRFVLPVLEFFWFQGVNEYLEELVARIDAPRLSQFRATFFNDLDFDTPELIRFVSHSFTPEALNEAHVVFEDEAVWVKLQPQASNVRYFEVVVLCREPDWQLSSLAQICTTSLPLLSSIENLFISELIGSQLDWKDGIEEVEWLELLLPFTAVKNLYLSKQFAPRVARALQEIAGGGTLSSLQNLYLEGLQSSEPVEEAIERFVSARQNTDYPIAISVWERPSDVIGEQ